MKTHPADSSKMLGSFIKDYGLTLDDKELSAELSRRVLYDTKEQLALFAKKDGGPSQIEQWMSDVADFFIQQGRLTPAKKEKLLKGGFINDKILKMIAQ